MEISRKWYASALEVCGVLSASSRQTCHNCRHARPVDGYWLWCEQRQRAVIGQACELHQRPGIKKREGA